jgi:hypothetical protein
MRQSLSINYVTEHNALPTFEMIHAATKTEFKEPRRTQGRAL